MTARAIVTFLLLLHAVLSQHQAPTQVKRRPEAGVNQIRLMKTAAVQIRYTSDAPTGATPQGMPILTNLRGDLAGTGFFVSRQAYVLTAGHVIRDSANSAREKGATNVQFKVGILLDTSSEPNVSFQGSFFFVDASPIEIDEVHDLALLKLSRNPFTGEVRSGIVTPRGMLPLKIATARLKPELPPEGRDVLISGYPLDIPTLVTQKGMVASESFSVVEMPMQGAPPGFRMPKTIDSILLDAVVNPGNSGGPVYEPDSGDVIGICEAYKNSPLFTNKRRQVEITPNEVLTQNSGLAVVIPIKYGIDLLRKNGVKDFSTE
jgi:serine protease Do